MITLTISKVMIYSFSFYLDWMGTVCFMGLSCLCTGPILSPFFLHFNSKRLSMFHSVIYTEASILHSFLCVFLFFFYLFDSLCAMILASLLGDQSYLFFSQNFQNKSLLYLHGPKIRLHNKNPGNI